MIEPTIVADIVPIELPLAYIGGVNVWLLRGKPLTLIDTGPANDDAWASLERQLGDHGVAVEDLELVLVTHHHLDHSGLASAIKKRSGAVIAAHRRTADWGRSYHEVLAGERAFTHALMTSHGVPADVIAGSEAFFERLAAESRPFDTDLVLGEGDTIRAGGRTLRVVFRPGHSATDTIFVDDASDDAFVGDHLLASITSGAEIAPTELPGDERGRALLDYLGNLRKTQAMQLRRCYTGHGTTIDDHRALIDERLGFHEERLGQIAALVVEGCDTAFAVARRLWSDETAESQPVLVTWEVVGHLDILVNRGTIREATDADGRRAYRPRD